MVRRAVAAERRDGEAAGAGGDRRLGITRIDRFEPASDGKKVRTDASMVTNLRASEPVKGESGRPSGRAQTRRDRPRSCASGADRLQRYPIARRLRCDVEDGDGDDDGKARRVERASGARPSSRRQE